MKPHMKYKLYKERLRYTNEFIATQDKNTILSKFKRVINTKGFQDWAIQGSFKDFLNGFKIYKNLHSNKGDIQFIKDLYLVIKRDMPLIFQIRFEDEEPMDKFNLIIPFSNFFIASPYYVEYHGEIYGTEGFLVGDILSNKLRDSLLLKEDYLEIFFFWSKHINDGWAFCSSLIKKDSIIKSTKDITEQPPFENPSLPPVVRKSFIDVFYNTMKKLLILIDKKEYTSYQKYTSNGMIRKNIVYANEKMTHKRHFWEDTGYFKVPNMNEEELQERGYKIDEVVYKDGQIRRDVPYKIIEPTSEDKKKQNIANRTINLYKKRIFRQEEKLYDILKLIFPLDFIKIHDRKMLKGLELDFFIREKRIAFEYDGEQHFDKKICEEVFKSDFNELKKRDRKKDKLCRRKNITLIRIKYDEPLKKSYIKKKIRNLGLEC